MVDWRLHRLHKRVVELRESVAEADVGAMKDALATWQNKFVPLFVVFNVILGVLFFAAIMLYKHFNP